MIARIAQLQVFNGSVIGARERRDSEKAYLRAALRETEAAEAGGLDLLLSPRTSSLSVLATPRSPRTPLLGGGELTPAERVALVVRSHPRLEELKGESATVQYQHQQARPGPFPLNL